MYCTTHARRPQVLAARRTPASDVGVMAALVSLSPGPRRHHCNQGFPDQATLYPMVVAVPHSFLLLATWLGFGLAGGTASIGFSLIEGQRPR